jgi:hypothetical protein
MELSGTEAEIFNDKTEFFIGQTLSICFSKK